MADSDDFVDFESGFLESSLETGTAGGGSNNEDDVEDVVEEEDARFEDCTLVVEEEALFAAAFDRVLFDEASLLLELSKLLTVALDDLDALVLEVVCSFDSLC